MSLFRWLLGLAENHGDRRVPVPVGRASTSPPGIVRVAIEHSSEPGISISFGRTYELTPDEKNQYDKIHQAFQGDAALPNILQKVLYVYGVELAACENIDERLLGLKKLQNLYADQWTERHSFLQLWISDSYAERRDYRSALQHYPRCSRVGGASVSESDEIVSLKLALGEDMDARDLVGWCGRKMTKFSRENIGAIIAYLEAELALLRSFSSKPLVSSFVRGTERDTYSIFVGCPYVRSVAKFSVLKLSAQPRLMEFIESLFREAVGTVKDEFVGPESVLLWNREVQLAKELMAHFGTKDVLRHVRPAWLVRNHLDFMLPRLKIAIDFDRADHVGGTAQMGGPGKAINKKRVAKHLLCEKNGIHLISVQENTTFGMLLSEIDKTKTGQLKESGKKARSAA